MPSPDLLASARDLRRRMTPPEAVLWERLRRHGLDGLHFRHQHSFGPYILDFACVDLLLGVELDGSVHLMTEAYDRDRDDFLKQHGWTIMRFPNDDDDDVETNLGGVLERISQQAARHSALKTELFFAEHKGKSNQEEFLRIWHREGGEPPRPGDELPEGWISETRQAPLPERGRGLGRGTKPAGGRGGWRS